MCVYGYWNIGMYTSNMMKRLFVHMYPHDSNYHYSYYNSYYYSHYYFFLIIMIAIIILFVLSLCINFVLYTHWPNWAQDQLPTSARCHPACWWYPLLGHRRAHEANLPASHRLLYLNLHLLWRGLETQLTPTAVFPSFKDMGQDRCTLAKINMAGSYGCSYSKCRLHMVSWDPSIAC